MELRVGGIPHHIKILVLGAPMPADVPIMIEWHLDAMLSSVAVAQRVASVVTAMPLDKPGSINVHLYVETGMTRLGVMPDEVGTTLDAFHGAGARVNLVGFCTHFAEADDPESDYTTRQLAAFRTALERVRSHPMFQEAKIDVHVSNSAALLDAQVHELIRGFESAYVRPGIALYGFYPEIASVPNDVASHWSAGEPMSSAHLGEGRRVWVRGLELHPSIKGQLEEALTLTAKVTNIIEVEAGTSVGYSRTWRAPTKCRIATLGCGYADGYPRGASNKAKVAIRGHWFPIVGNVCMDMTMVSLGDDGGAGAAVEVGDEAILFGRGGITASELAHHCGTIHYEILTGVQKRVARVYDNETPVREERALGVTKSEYAIASLLHEETQ